MLCNFQIKTISGQVVYLYKIGNKNPVWTYTFRDRRTGEVMASYNFEENFQAVNHARERIKRK